MYQFYIWAYIRQIFKICAMATKNTKIAVDLNDFLKTKLFSNLFPIWIILNGFPGNADQN